MSKEAAERAVRMLITRGTLPMQVVNRKTGEVLSEIEVDAEDVAARIGDRLNAAVLELLKNETPSD